MSQDTEMIVQFIKLIYPVKINICHSSSKK